MIGSKLAAIFGAEVPSTVTSPVSVIPMSSRVRDYENYLQAKSREAPTHPGKAALVGGLVSAIPVGLVTHLSGAGGGSSAAVAGLAGILGAGMGALAAGHDRYAIADAQRTLLDARKNKGVLTKRVESAIEAQRAYEQGARERAADYRTDRVVRAVRTAPGRF